MYYYFLLILLAVTFLVISVLVICNHKLFHKSLEEKESTFQCIVADSVDMISHLPDFILHHILASLPTRDAAKTCILSKKWKCVYESFPILDFHQDLFGLGPLAQKRYYRKAKDWERLSNFTNYVDSTLHRFLVNKFKVKKFKLSMVLGDEGLDTLVNKWMGLLVEIQVNELYYRTLLPTRSRPQWKIFPEVIFAAESITVLNLFGCKLENASTGSGIKFRYLREVVLEQVYLDEKMIQDFNDSCLLIKLFSLRHCKGFKIFHLNGLPKLKKVLLDVLEFVEVQMRTPSLQFCNLHMAFGYQGKIDLAACQGLKSLIVRGAFITDLLLQEFTSRLLLETLELYHCDMGEMVIISRHRLKHLILFHAEDAIEIMIDTPNLLSFQYSGSIIPCISSINPSCQWDAAFSLYNNHVLDALWLSKLNEFVGVCRQTKVLNLSIMTDEINVSFPNIEEEDWIRLRPYGIEHLKLHIPSFTKLNFAGLVNGLFQSCRPKLVSVKTIYEDGKEFMMFLQETLLEKEEVHCCCTTQIKCWRHYLSNVKIESFGGTDFDSHRKASHFSLQWRPVEYGEKAEG